MSADLTFEAACLADTEAFAEAWARVLKTGDAIGLRGELGAGKTAFARALILALGHDQEVPSPTFTLVQVYELPDHLVWHVDLYRIEDERELVELDLDTAFEEALTLIEWPERLGGAMPEDYIDIQIIETGENSRQFRVTGQGKGLDRVSELEARL